MKEENRVLLFSLSAGMELCYLYAGATFVTTAIFHQPFPFPEAVGSFLAAALLTLLAEGRGWRVVYVLGLQSLGFIPALLTMVGIFDSWSNSFSSQTWFTGYFSNSTDAIEYFVFVLVIAWALVFWAGGVGLARRQKDYFTLCSRFDRGLIVFFILFLTKFYFEAVQGIRVDESMSGFFIFPFLIFSLLAIGLVRTRSAGHRDFIPGYQTIGVLLGFIVVVLLTGTGLAFFFLPYLTLAAQRGSDILNIVSGPLVSTMFAILAWLFGTDFAIKNLPAEPTPLPQSSTQLSFPGWLEFFGRILAWGVGILVALVFLAILGGLLYGISQWLFSRTSVNQKRESPRDLFSALTAPLYAMLLFFWRGLIRSFKGYNGAIQLYTALRDWGSHSGLPHFPSETPSEYGRRLSRQFSVFEREIESIIESFNREVYGETVLNRQQLLVARSAWRRLASPLHYPMRLKAWFLRFSHHSETA